MKDLNPFLKQCIAEVLVEPTKEGKYSSLALAALLGFGATKAMPHGTSRDTDSKPRTQMADPTKELPSEKDVDAWDLANKYSGNKEKVAKGLEPMMKMTKFIKECIAEVIVEPNLRKRKVHGNPRRLQAAYLIKECVLEVLRENLSEAFDPTSQGPNIPQENPYPEMNAKMRVMDEGELQVVCMHCKRNIGTKHVDGPDRTEASHGICRDCWNIHYKPEHGDFPEEPPKSPTVEGGGKPKVDAWERYEKGYSAGEAHKRSGIKPKDKLDSVASIGYHDAIKGKAKASKDVVRKTVRETDSGEIATNPHGRYSQESGGGQFDPRTFGKLDFDGVDESSKTQSANVEWICPHCGQTTNIPVEIESPSDYIACADCEHCGKEISDPRLDQKVYAIVIDYYAGKADYHSDK
jgi:DNA-directed RNA polymerase subunit RPC12/RpoP